jgi:hypothetical protein
MNSFTYWPYDEVSLEFKAANGDITLKTPWLEAKCSGAHFDTTAITALSSKMNDKTLGPNDVNLVSNFFRHFHQYPIAYILPEPKAGAQLDCHALKDKSLLQGSLIETMKEIFAHPLSTGTEFTHADFSFLLPQLPRHHWEWDHRAALDFASIHNKIHPESLLSIARRFHLLEIMQNDKGISIFRAIENAPATSFKSALCKLIRQNHFVTEKCQEALQPALRIAQQAAPMIKDFMEAERGHDKILKKALLHLDEEPENIAVSVPTKALMIMLAYVADRNFLAFAMAIDAFERNNFEEVDPIAKLLAKGGYQKAADFINLHMKINDEGHHDNIASTFLKYMDLCDEDYAQEAMRLMEILSLIMGKISQVEGISP